MKLHRTTCAVRTAALLSLISATVAATALAQTPAPVAAAADLAQTTDLISACIGCHAIPGYQASFPRVYRVPMIAGQSAKYIEVALTAYKRGERSHPTMTVIAKGLSDQQIQTIAGYYASLGTDAP